MIELMVIGKFHPLLVHLPIGMLVLAFTMELASRFKTFAHLKTSIPFVLLLTTLSAVVSSFTGWIMPKEGAFDEYLLGMHFWFAISLTIGSALLYYCSTAQSTWAKRLYLPLLLFNMLLLTITGHFGGSLTHGSNYLFEEGPKNIVIEGKVEDIQVYDQIIAGIFKNKCVSCHNEGKLKGQLLMTSQEGLVKGGETGPMFVANDAKNSLFIQRIELPKTDKLHMPPNGKVAVTNEELKLFKWWVNTGASFQKTVKELETPKDILTILEKYKTSHVASPIARLKPVEVSTINDIRAKGILVTPLDSENKTFEATLAYDTLITKNKLKALRSIDQNLLKLNLSFSNLNDNLLSYIADFENLQKLDVQQTNITAKGLTIIEDFKHLQSLNLYRTPVDDTAISTLSQLPSLQKLYLWESNMTEQGIASLQKERPNLHIEYKVDLSIFGEAQLKAPRFDVEEDLFKDSLLITLIQPFNGVQIHYTLDGSLPDSTAERYEKSFLIDKTTQVSAVAKKEGWLTSEPVQRVFLQTKNDIADIQLSTPPNEKYAAKGASSLVDLQKGSTQFSDGMWLGFQGEHVTTTLNLGATKKIENVSVGALEDTGSYIFFPKNIVVEISTDGKNYSKVAEKIIATAAEPQVANVQTYLLDFESQVAQFVRIQIKSNLKNPSWHVAPGAPCWVFLDEIVVN